MPAQCCQYQFEPATWARNHGRPTSVQDSWSCPRSAVDGTDYCPFHLPPADREANGIDPADVRRQLRQELTSGEGELLRFIGATLGDLSLPQVVIDRATNDAIDFRHATVTGDIVADGATIRQPVLLDETEVRGQFSASNVHFGHPVRCAGMTVAGPAQFENTTFEDEVVFRNVTLQSDTTFQNANFRRDTDFYRLRAEKPISFQNTEWLRLCQFQMATFRDRADFFSSSFHQQANFRSASFGGTARFSKSVFDGEVLYLASAFEEEALFKKIDFDSHAYFQSVTFSNEASFSETTFREKTKFQFAQFHGEAAISYATFEGNAYFQRVQFRSYAEFFECTFHKIADFRWASFHDVGRFMDTRFVAEAYFGHAEFLDVADFRRARFEHAAVFRRSHFSYSPMFQQTEIELVRFLDLETETSELTVNLEAGTLSRGRIEQTNDTSVSYNFQEAKLGDLELTFDAPRRLFENILISRTDFDGFDFTRYRYALAPEWKLHRFAGEREFDYDTEASRFVLEETESTGGHRSSATDEQTDTPGADSSGPSGLSAPASRLADFVRSTLGLPESIQDAPRLETTYLKAKNGANQVGDSRSASAFFVQEMYYRRYAHLKRALSDSERIVTRIRSTLLATMNWLLSISCGYGEKPYRTLVFSVGIILFYTLVYALMLETPPADSGLGYLLFSFQSFTALILGVDTDPFGMGPSFVAASQGFVGAFLIGLFVFTLTRSIHR